MSNFFQEIDEGFVWIGKELVKAVDWAPRLMTIVSDVEADTPTILPELGAVIDDAGVVVTAAVKDSGADIAAAEALIAAVTAACAAKALNIAADSAVVSAFETFIGTITASSNYAALLTAVKMLVTDYDKLGATVKTALAKLESDADAA
jgi:hypothetical protein